MARTNVYVRNIFWLLLCFGFAVSIAQASNPVNGQYIVTVILDKDSTSVPQDKIDSYCPDGWVCWGEYVRSDKYQSFYKIMGTPTPVCSETETWNGTECIEDTQPQCPDGQEWNGLTCGDPIPPDTCGPDSPNLLGTITASDGSTQYACDYNDRCPEGYAGGYVNDQWQCIGPDKQPPICAAGGVIVAVGDSFVCESPEPVDQNTDDSNTNPNDNNTPDNNDNSSNTDETPEPPRDPRKQDNDQTSPSENITQEQFQANKNQNGCYANGVYLPECASNPDGPSDSCLVKQNGQIIEVANCTKNVPQSCTVGNVTYQDCIIQPGNQCIIDGKLFYGCTPAGSTTVPGDNSTENNNTSSVVFSPGQIDNLYSSDDSEATVDDVMKRFKARIQSSQIYATATGFFDVNVSGSCQAWTIPSVLGMGAITVDFQCSSTMATVLDFAKYILLATAAFVAFRWAFL
jgi:hypothetical protein